MSNVILAIRDGSKNAKMSIVRPSSDALVDTYLKYQLKGLRTAVIDESILPNTNYSEAFKDFDAKGNITIDLNLAKHIHSGLIRAARNQALFAQDALYVKAYESKDKEKMESVEASKQALRDAPSTVKAALEAASNLEQVMAVWPNGLAK